MVRHDAQQRRVHIARHARGIAADIEMGAILQPAPQVRALFEHAVLDIDLLALVAGKGEERRVRWPSLAHALICSR
jgi:hypothetical protein